MKQLTVKILACIAVALGVLSCDKVIYINIDTADRKIVINGMLNPDSTVTLHIACTQQLSVTGPADTSALHPDPLVVKELLLYENDRLIGGMVSLRDNFYGTPGFRPREGRSYRVEVTAGEMEPAWASVTVPGPVVPEAFDTAGIWLENGHRAIRIFLRLADPGSEVNYYALQVSGVQRRYDHQKEIYYDDSLMVLNFPPRFLPGTENGPFGDLINAGKVFYLSNNGIQSMIFPDELFNGRTLEMTLEYPDNYYSFMDDRVHFRVDLMQVNRSCYDYAVSLSKYHDAANNPFAEPVQVYTNVANGFGLFTSCNGVRREFTVEWATVGLPASIPAK